MNYLFTQLFRLWENAFFQRQEGTLDPTLWAAWEHVMCSYFQQPGVQEWWPARRLAYSSKFRDFLEASGPVPDGLRTWQQLVEPKRPDSTGQSSGV